ncbi:MAG TPA: zinc-binding dehydrogenase [Pyrinomonadaceae bacterium]|nr:zinc-binding dehydrogenase [Pyrinomonadaceae bacterium]
MQSAGEAKQSTSATNTVPGRAAVVHAPGEVVVEETQFREPEAGEVRVRIEGCGVCASNVPLWEGKPWFEYPMEPGAPGHEAWGRIDAVGPGVTDLARGQRVGLLSSHAFAEYDFAKGAEVVQLPSDLDNQPFPAEPLGCAINIFKRARISPGENVCIVGVGFLGTLLTQLAVNAGARVFALSHRRSSLKLAHDFGATAAVEVNDEQQAMQTVRRMTNGRGCECVIEAAGTQESLDLSSELTSERGRLVIAGYHQDGPRQVNMQLWNWRGLDIINAHERDPLVYVEGMREAITAVQNGDMNPWPLYTHEFDLAELPRAFETLSNSPEGFIKALITV